MGLHDVAWRLPAACSRCSTAENWADCVTAHRIGADSARIAGDRLGEAWALRPLGFALGRLRDSEAFAPGAGAGDQAGARRHAGEAQTALSLADGYHKLQGPGEAALRTRTCCKSSTCCAPIRHLHGIALNNLGEAHFGLGILARRRSAMSRRATFASDWRPRGRTRAEQSGPVYLCQGRPAEAIARLEALDKHRASGDLCGEAMALKGLGEAYRAGGA